MPAAGVPPTNAHATPARVRALAAIARSIAPHAFEDPARGQRLVARVARRFGRVAPHKTRDLWRAVTLLGSPLGPLLAGALPRPFAALRPERQQFVMERWLASPLPVVRTAVQAIRRVVLLEEYGTPEAQQEVGYRGAYHSRGPAVPWEGALPGTLSDAEPVARAADPASAHRPPAQTSTLKPPTPAIVDATALRADAVVIGSGAGGAVAAARLAEAGLDVLVLEAGALRSGDAFHENEAPLFEELYADAGLRTTDDASVALVQGVGVGGSTIVNWMIMLRTPDWVLDEWTARHGTEGLSPSELAPVFARIEAETHARRVPDDAHSPNNRIILDGARALGWSASSGLINARECVRTGFCGYGCRSGAKQDATRTFLPRAVNAGARLFAHSTVVRIDVVERSSRFPKKRLTVHHSPPDGAARTVTVEASIVVVAGGAVETPLLLQRSALGSAAVGRYLRLHPTTGLFAHFDREIYPAGGIPLSAVCDEFHQLDANGYGVWIECPPLHPALAASALPGFGAAHRERMLGFRNAAALIVLTRDGAERDASDGAVRVRRDGTASIQYRLSRTDAQHLERGIHAGAELLFAGGAREVSSAHARPVSIQSPRELDRLRGQRMGPNSLALFSAHVNGTCRMGTSSRTAGVDPTGQVFGAPGVFVADGSLLPTAPGVNPQETIMAVATVVTERVASTWRTG